MIQARRLEVRLIEQPPVGPNGPCTLSNPKVREIFERAHERQVQMAAEGNPYAQAYLIRDAGLGHLIDGPLPPPPPLFVPSHPLHLGPEYRGTLVIHPNTLKLMEAETGEAAKDNCLMNYRVYTEEMLPEDVVILDGCPIRLPRKSPPMPLHEYKDATKELPPEGKVVIVLNGTVEQRLKRHGRLWYLADGSMYVYWTPRYWRFEDAEKKVETPS